MSAARVLGLLALGIASASLPGTAAAEEPLPDLAGHFRQICGTTDEAGPALPGNDVAAADAPGFFAGDLRRATQSRVVKIGDRYAMRALVPASADPADALLVKCAVGAGSTAYAEQVDRLSAILSTKPLIRAKTVQDLDYAQFMVGNRSYTVFSEPDGWVSIYKLEVMMREPPRKYLKKGARPVPAPSVR